MGKGKYSEVRSRVEKIVAWRRKACFLGTNFLISETAKTSDSTIFATRARVNEVW